MRICIGNKYHSFDGSVSGKGKFAIRLMSALKELGHYVTSNPEESVDVDLQFTHRSYNPIRAKKSIMRYGPAEVDYSIDYKWRNAEKWKSMRLADGIVYQSQYSKMVNDLFVGKPKVPTTIIFNGAPGSVVEASAKDGPINILASTRVWLPQKRLSDIVEAFKLLDENCFLWVAGDTAGNKIQKHERIKLLGNRSDSELAALYAICRVMVHIVWLDACPNSVVECIMAGTPVVCNNVGGTHELVLNGKTGIVSDLDKPYKFAAVNLIKPPHVDHKILAESIKDALKIGKPVHDERLDILTVAGQYVDFFNRVLSGRNN